MKKLRGRRVRQYSINDFINWKENGELILVPWFQRRAVWTNKAKSYLIDTILLNLPVPIIIMRESINPKNGKTIREVVDGQQRLRAIFEFYEGDLGISSVHREDLAGFSFEDIPQGLKDRFREYELAVNTLLGASDPEVLDIFGRLNSYTQVLNRQEKLNAKYHGAFKTFIYRLSGKYLGFFIDNRVLSKRAILRMTEAELISEIVIAMLAGLQDRKTSIEDFYRNHDDDFVQKEEMTQKFGRLISIVQRILGEELESSEYRRRVLFYSLCCVFYDLIYGMPGQGEPQRITIPESSYGSICERLLNLSTQLDLEPPDPEYSEFVTACARQTDNIKPRQIRHQWIKKTILDAL